jgi:predicted RNase H-like HicB family nuclease
MEIPVLLEPLPDGGFRARSGDPLELMAQGDSPDSALRNLRDLIDTRIASGFLLTTIEVQGFRASRHSGAGIYRDEPLFDQWRAAIDAYRQEIEDDPEIP